VSEQACTQRHHSRDQTQVYTSFVMYGMILQDIFFSLFSPRLTDMDSWTPLHVYMFQKKRKIVYVYAAMHFKKLTTSAADPGPGAFLTFGSGIRDG
jgi:hypothetical protein